MNTSIHSERLEVHQNGNQTVYFHEGSKQRRIIFTKNSQALSDFTIIRNHFQDLIESIVYMKKHYVFKACENNSSIFRPHVK